MSHPSTTYHPVLDDELVVAISTDDTFLHVSTARDLLAHMHHEHGDDHHASHDGHDGRALEFFGASAQHLIPVLNPDLHVIGFRVDAEAVPRPDDLHHRITRALDLAQARLDADPTLGVQQSLPPATHVPRPSGTLPDVITALTHEFDVRSGPGHRAGWFHNLFHV